MAVPPACFFTPYYIVLARGRKGRVSGSGGRGEIGTRGLFCLQLPLILEPWTAEPPRLALTSHRQNGYAET